MPSLQLSLTIRQVKHVSVLVVSTVALALIFAMIPQSLVHAGGAAGGGGSSGGGTGGAQTKYGFGWYNFPTNGSTRPQYMRDGGDWADVMKKCSKESANRIIAFIVFQDTKTVATSVVYRYDSGWLGYSGYMGNNGGNWLTAPAAHELFNKLDSATKAPFNWGKGNASSVAWFCYDSSLPSAKITAEASVSDSKIVLGDSVTFTNDLKISNVNNTRDDTFDYKITSSGPDALPAPGIKSYTNVSIFDARTTSNGRLYTFTPPAVGHYCRKIKASGAPDYVVYPVNPAEACVDVVQVVTTDYTLTPTVTLGSDAIEAGELLTVNPSVKNSSSDNSNPTVWKLTRTTPAPSATLSSASNITFPGGLTNLSPYPDNDTNFDVGTQLCYVLSVQPHGATDLTEYTSTPPVCATIGKRPKTQIWAGDLNVGGDVVAKPSTKNSTTYGSWSEYGIVASGGITGAASGAAFAGAGLANATICGENVLSFSNTVGSACTENADAIGHYQSDANIPPVADNFLGTGNPIPGTVTPSALNDIVGDNTYNAGDVTLNASNLPAGKTVVIKSTGTVTIAGNQTYADGKYTNISQLPQLVIIAKSIMINANVDRVDAWLVATNNAGNGTIYTCNDEGKTTNECSTPLKVNGPVMTDKLYLRRTAGSDDSNLGAPAEIFNLRADAYLWAINQASNKTYIQTVYNTELPPRF